MIVDDAAQAMSLANDYGSNHGPASPATFYFAIFADSGMTTELTNTAGVPRIPVANTDAQLAITGTLVANVNDLVSSASTGLWPSTGLYGAFMDDPTVGVKWDGGALSEPAVNSTVGTIITIPAGSAQFGF